MRTRLLLVLVLVATALGACSSSGSSSRTVQVDGASDDFAGTFRAYFPRDVTVNPGMTVKFHQTWTGEAHTVTLGTEIQDIVEPKLLPLVEKYAPLEPTEEQTGQAGAGEDIGRFYGTLPFFYNDSGVNQAAAQPCFLDKGLPSESGKPCKQIAQPAFTGKQSYYSSGFIPYLGERGNEFEMKIADNAKAGEYFYYCALHGPAMSGKIIVTDDKDIPSQADVNRQGKKERDAIAKPMLAQLEKERAGKGSYTGNLAGSGPDKYDGVMGQVNEFSPRTVLAKVGEPVSWTFVRGHSISFNVPAYLPLTTVEKSGKVVENEKVYAPAGGWPGRDPALPDGDPDAAEPVPAVQASAPDFDGSKGLKSSGVEWQTGDTYSVTFAKAGTYPMACLIHPGMIGKVVVS